MKRQFLAAENYCCSVRDGTHDTPVPTSSGFKLVTGKHIKNGVIDPYDAYYISEDDFNSINARSRVEKWDVLMSMIGTVGEAAVVADTPLYAIKNVALFKCGGSEIKGKWLAYYLRSEEAKGHMRGNMKGSSQQFLSLKQLRSLPIPIVSEHEMKKNVNVLSAYDDLIENNRKQIKLLEEAAQRLYKEWFIDLRFPGYENTKIINGLPAGWEKKTVGQLLNKFERTKQVQAADYLETGLFPIIDQSRNFIAGYTNDAETLIQHSQPIIVFGDHTRILKLISFPFAKGADGTQIIVSNDSNMPQHLFYCSLREIDLSNYHYARHFKYLKAEEILVPIKKIAQKIEMQLSYFFTKIQQCRNVIIKSESARNILLPKLMNGEFEVK